MAEAEASSSEENIFCVDRAKQGKAACKHCKNKCLQGDLRIAKLVPNNFGPGKMKHWYHVDCMFEVFAKQRQATKRIESYDDIDGWKSLNDEDKQLLLDKISASNAAYEKKFGVKIQVKQPVLKISGNTSQNEDSISTASDISIKNEANNSDTFRNFRKLVADITSENSYLEKTKLVNKALMKGSDGNGFKGDIKLWCRLLLPGAIIRTYNLQSKQLIKLFSKIFRVNYDKMIDHSEKGGDVSKTIEHYFGENHEIRPAKKSTLALQEVDEFLEELSCMTKEDDQISHFQKIIKKCTSHDLKTIIKLIKHDLQMNAGPKHILQGIHEDAYKVFQNSKDINIVIETCSKTGKINKTNINVKSAIVLFVPFQPMLAEMCKSAEDAFKKYPNGMFAEIKYDGERVQVHKRGNEFKYFSRSLKPVTEHKVAHVKSYIMKAFPHGKDLILDTEILMMDKSTGKPLPFGTLGIHKRSEFKDASVCLFVFDCLYYNGEILTNKPIKQRKAILKENMTEMPNHIVFSESKQIFNSADLDNMIADVLNQGLEGLVLKDLNSIYEPGKRHWMKIKKDYLQGGAMADSADLLVLGTWYGTGKKGGMMSVFLMGCYDKETKRFCTVTKVHTGLDDKTLKRLQNELVMDKVIDDKIPSWLNCNKSMIPDFVAKNPKHQPVWEIIGAEFTQHNIHTADGISIRFPRVKIFRDDKNWKTATNLEELKTLFKKSKEGPNLPMNNIEDTKKKNKRLLAQSDEDSILDTDLDVSTTKKRKEVKKKNNKTSAQFDEDNTDNIVDTDPDTSTSTRKKESNKKCKKNSAQSDEDNAGLILDTDTYIFISTKKKEFKNNNKKNKQLIVQSNEDILDTELDNPTSTKKKESKKKNKKQTQSEEDNAGNSLDTDTDVSTSTKTKKSKKKNKKQPQSDEDSAGNILDTDTDISTSTKTKESKKKNKKQTQSDEDSAGNLLGTDTDISTSTKTKDSRKKNKKSTQSDEDSAVNIVDSDTDISTSTQTKKSKKKNKKQSQLDENSAANILDTDTNISTSTKTKELKTKNKNDLIQMEEDIPSKTLETDVDVPTSTKKKEVKKNDKNLFCSSDENINALNTNTDNAMSKKNKSVKNSNTSMKSEVKSDNENVNKNEGKRKLSMPDLVENKKIKLFENKNSEFDKVKEPLPNYFSGVKLLLNSDVKDKFSDCIEDFKACGGKILKPEENMEAGYILHFYDTISEPSIECSKLAKHVIVEWIRDSIKNKRLEDYRPYTVRLKPCLMK